MQTINRRNFTFGQAVWIGCIRKTARCSVSKPAPPRFVIRVHGAVISRPRGGPAEAVHAVPYLVLLKVSLEQWLVSHSNDISG